MPITVKKRAGESGGALIYRFIKKVRQSGILREAKERRFRKRPPSRIKRRLSALHKEEKQQEAARAKKLGVL